ncbi:hypothetical protein [Nocardioides mangrovi]|uniref:DUF5134 domain-containing protein n=1 Tax=Nocardioides mangrovi TaxID=2874580 RepID=A0ABS7UFL1_9ACTN|nr:hypothetical protein [Nocardioides mangrovi]MBZ5739437.1 hypothetical protein [Nocardioides mangrovi]
MGGTGDVVAVGLALALGVATVHCLARCVVPRWRSEHGGAVDAWHVLMGVAMIAMLLAPVGSGAATVQAMVFGIGALWCACHLVASRRVARPRTRGSARPAW